ncbi:MAG: helix-turn-helix domain-containing protein [bacterium]
MYNKYPLLYKQVLDEYFVSKSSIRNTAKKFDLHYQTVYKWIKKYKSSGEKAFFEHKRPHNRIPEKIERLIVRYKEKFPYLTVRQAQNLLIDKGIRISWYGIWNVWHRYGYCGFGKENIGNDFTDFVPLTPESKKRLKEAERLYELGRIEESAKILNKIPWLPKNEIVLNLPDELLNTRRKIEKLIMQFGKISISEYIKKTKILYQKCIKNQWNYSALRIGITLLVALSWYGSPEEQKKWTEKVESLLSPMKKRARDLFPVYLTLLISKCHTLVQNLEMGEAIRIARYSYRIIMQHKRPLYDFMYDLAIQFIDLEDYNTAEKLLKKAMEGIDEQRKKRLKTLRAIYIHLLRGDKKTAQRLLKEAEIYDWAKDAQIFRFQSYFALIEGKPSEALNLAQEALNISKRAGLLLDIANAYLAMASAYMSLGETKKAKNLLKDNKKFLRKKRVYRQLLVTNVLLEKIPAEKEILKLPTIRLAWLLRKTGYKSAYEFALKKGLMLYFYRYLFFYSQIVQNRIIKNKPTFLPKTILRLPIFNPGTIVYRINFLGRLTIYRNQNYIKEKLTPKDTGVLLHIIHKIPEPEKSCDASDILVNFWQNSPDGARLLSHSLVRIRKILKIPAHYLEIKSQTGESILINNNLYFHTDYQEFTQTLARARALERAGEWEFARKEYLRAFKLFRGEPFKKNFDDWSVNMRFKILTELETEAINFAKSCIQHGNKNDARKILQKGLKIIPDSEEAKGLLDSLIV